MAGNDISCALAADWKVRCWGNPGSGLEFPPTSERFTAVTVGGNLSDFVCAVGEDTRLDCWGGGSTSGDDAVDSPGSTGWVAVAAGLFHACALSDTDTVECWGSQEEFEDTPDEPLNAIGTANYVACALKSSDGGGVCWGPEESDTKGLLSEPSTGGWSQIAGGNNQACLRNAAGEVTCWGNDDDAYGLTVVSRTGASTRTSQRVTTTPVA
jgi:hypothetical protein